MIHKITSGKGCVARIGTQIWIILISHYQSMFSVPFATPNILPLEQTRKSMQKAKEMVYLKTPRLWCTSAIQGSSRVHLTGLTTNTEIVDFRGFNLFGGSRLKKPKNLQEPPRTSKNLQGPREQNWTQNRRRHIAWGASWRDWDRKINFCGIASPRWSECPIFGQPTGGHEVRKILKKNRSVSKL